MVTGRHSCTECGVLGGYVQISNMGRLLQAQGKLDEAEPLYREDLAACRETLGDRHPDTLTSVG